MNVRTIVKILLATIFPIVTDGYFGRENIPKGPIDSNDVGLYITNPNAVYNGGASKTIEKSLRNNGDMFGDLENFEETDWTDNANETSSIFGERVIESIKKHGVVTDDRRCPDSGRLKIDWWKKSRRLKKMRERLYDEIEKNPGLRQRLDSIGWLDDTNVVSQNEKIGFDRDHAPIETLLSNVDRENPIFYKISVMRSKPDRSVSDLPIKFGRAKLDRTSPNTEATVATYNVVAFVTKDAKFSRNEESSITANPSVQTMDGERVLKLIPLLVTELSGDRMSEDEQRTFRRIFGRRLWILIERESTKKTIDTMDHDLAKFILCGQLPDRDSLNVRREKNSKLNANDRNRKENFDGHVGSQDCRNRYDRDCNRENEKKMDTAKAMDFRRFLQ